VFIEFNQDFKNKLFSLSPVLKILSLILTIIIIVSQKDGTWFNLIGFLSVAFIIVLYLIIKREIKIFHVLYKLVTINLFIMFLISGLYLFTEFNEPYTYFTFITDYGPIKINYITYLFLKIFTCILYLTIYQQVTTFTSFITGLKQLRLPNIMIDLLSLGYRYLFLFGLESDKMKQAMQLRTKLPKNILYTKFLGFLLGNLLIRVIDRSFIIYNAMLCRGYENSLMTCNKININKTDWLIFTSYICVIISIRFINILH